MNRIRELKRKIIGLFTKPEKSRPKPVPQSSKLLSLPQELRQQILHHTIPNNRILDLDCTIKRVTSPITDALVPALQTCRQLYADGIAQNYRECITLRITKSPWQGPRTIRAALQWLGEKRLKRFRKFEILWPERKFRVFIELSHQPGRLERSWRKTYQRKWYGEREVVKGRKWIVRVQTLGRDLPGCGMFSKELAECVSWKIGELMEGMEEELWFDEKTVLEILARIDFFVETLLPEEFHLMFMGRWWNYI